MRMPRLCHDKLNAASTARAYDGARMIDNFALALSHGLMLLAAWRLLRRPDLDDDAALPPPSKTPEARPGA
jgi:hypothetical protein